MARPLRLVYPGAVYHVMARGQERGAIFRDDEDRERFLGDLAAVVGEQRWALHAYCLMTNHYHLLVETPEANLSTGMQLLNGRYSQAYNLRHGRKGHLFEDRYKAIVVEKEGYLLELGSIGVSPAFLYYFRFYWGQPCIPVLFQEWRDRPGFTGRGSDVSRHRSWKRAKANLPRY